MGDWVGRKWAVSPAPAAFSMPVGGHPNGDVMALAEMSLMVQSIAVMVSCVDIVQASSFWMSR